MSESAKPARVGGPPSGVPARGYSWPPFEAGNTAALAHGMRAELALSDRSRRLADVVRAAVAELGLYQPAHEIAVEMAATALARVESWDVFAAQAAETGDLDKARWADGRASAWWSHARRALGDLGLTPAALARLERDDAIGRHVEARRRLDEHLAAEHDDDGAAAADAAA